MLLMLILCVGEISSTGLKVSAAGDEELTEDEKNLCEILIRDYKSSDILLATDPSLGRQVRINYATFNSQYSLVKYKQENYG